MIDSTLEMGVQMTPLFPEVAFCQVHGPSNETVTNTGRYVYQSASLSDCLGGI